MTNYINGKSGKRIIFRINSDGSVYVYIQNGADVIKAEDIKSLLNAWNKEMGND